MSAFTQDPIGLIHLLTAILAMIFGTIVILRRKGTRIHKQLGYAYVISMLIMLVTSLMIYRLFGGFGIFHAFSIVALITLAGGIIPAMRRKSANWIAFHFSFMYWSIIGLYAAFVSEALTRIPETPFFGMLGVATFMVIGLGYGFWYRYKKIWSQQFLKLPSKNQS